MFDDSNPPWKGVEAVEQLKTIARFLVLAFMTGPLLSACTWACWQQNGIPICTAPRQQMLPTIISDGAGGAIITWWDDRDPADYHIYAQRVDPSGTVLWTLDGVAVCTVGGGQFDPEIASDEAGGAIIVWRDLRNGGYSYFDIYAQRVDPSGRTLWPADGVPICTSTGLQTDYRIIADGVGGAIITWSDSRGGSDDDIYAQRVDASGSASWTVNGVPICTAVGDQDYPELVSDCSGGAIITWEDGRSAGNKDVYAQRIDAFGVISWVANGVSVCSATGNQENPCIVPDGAGGAIVAWSDYRTGKHYDVYAQRIDASGAVLWKANGAPICTAIRDQSLSEIISDASGGAIITWSDYRNGINYDIYAQRVGGSGSNLWTANGAPVCLATGSQSWPELASDGVGGAVVTWMDNRDWSTSKGDIYAQHLDASGNRLWAAEGVAICNATESQEYPQIAPDGEGGAIIAWDDDRGSYSNADIYAQRATCGPTGLTFASASATGHSGYVNLSWQMVVDVPASTFGIERCETPDGRYTALELAVVKNSQYSFSCIDRSVSYGKTYWYKIVLEGPLGGESYGPIEVRVDAVPTAYQAYQSYPNPFNPLCTIRYDIPRGRRVSLRVIDVRGTVVRMLVDAWREPGVYGETWDGRDDAGKQLPSGVYFYRLEARDFVATRKMVLLR
jgi:hypothetical protein